MVAQVLFESLQPVLPWTLNIAQNKRAFFSILNTLRKINQFYGYRAQLFLTFAQNKIVLEIYLKDVFNCH